MGQARKVVGSVTITLYDDGMARLDGELEAQPAPLTNVRFFRDMLRAGTDAFEKHVRFHSRNRIVVPTGILR